MRKTSLAFLFALIAALSYGQSLVAIDSLKRALRKADKDTLRALVLRELSAEYRNINSDSALTFGLQALELSTQIKFPRGQARAYNALAGVYRQLGDFPKCWEATNTGLEIASENHLYLEQALSLNARGIIYGSMGDDVRAVDYYKKALQVNSLAQSGFLKQELDAALSNNIGTYFLRIKDADSALFYFHKSLNFPGNNQNPQTLANLGAAEVMHGQLEAGLAHMREALQLSHRRGNLNITGLAHRTLAEAFMKIHEIDSAVLHSQKGLVISQSLKSQMAIKLHAKNLATIYDTLDVKQAYFYQKIADAANEQLQGQAQTNKMQRAMLDEMERQNAVAAKKQEEETRLKQIIFISSVFVLLIVVFILLRSNQKEKRAKLLVEAKNKEIQATQRQLIQSEKMASLGELTAGIAHEIQNPLNFVNNFSEVNTELIDELKKELVVGNRQLAEEIVENIKGNEEKINHHGKRAADIVKGMLQHSRTSSGQKELTDINALCDEYLRLSYHGLRAKDKSFNARFGTEFDSSLPKVNVVPQDMGRVILNLINNAFYAVSEKSSDAKASEDKTKLQAAGYEPTVIVSTYYSPFLRRGAGGEVEIRVKDNGLGIPDSIKEKIFQPFFTTKPTGLGTGLGLSLSYDIVRAHGGELKVETREGESSTFIIHLPLHE